MRGTALGTGDLWRWVLRRGSSKPPPGRLKQAEGTTPALSVTSAP